MKMYFADHFTKCNGFYQFVSVMYYAKNVHQIIQYNGPVKKLKTRLSVTNKNFPEKSPYIAISWLSFLNLYNTVATINTTCFKIPKILRLDHTINSCSRDFHNKEQ